MSATMREAHGLTSVEAIEAIEAGKDEKTGEFTGHGARLYLPITDR